MYKHTRQHFIKIICAFTASLFAFSWTLSSCTKEIKPFDFIQVCDPQLGFGGYEHDLATFRQAVKQINALSPAFVVICGDLVNTPDDKSFADFNAIKAELTVPCYCVPGNHDIGGEPTAESLERYREVIGDDYYTFNHEGYAFLVVNTQLWKASVEGESEKHDTWFRQQLKSSSEKAKGVFVIGHYPLYLEKPDEKEGYFNLPVEKRGKLLTLFEEHGVVAMLAGHTHKTIINDYKGVQLVNGEATSRNFDERPLGFRVWHVADPRPFKHDFIALEEKQWQDL